MAKVIVTRTRQLTGAIQPYEIFIDGKRVGSIGSGKTIETEVEPGQHAIAARTNDFRGNRVVFVVEPEGCQHFEVCNGLYDLPWPRIRLGVLVWPFLASIVTFALLPLWVDQSEYPLAGGACQHPGRGPAVDRARALCHSLGKPQSLPQADPSR